MVLLNTAIHASHGLAWGAFGLGGMGVDPGSRWPAVLLLPCAAGCAVSALRAAASGLDAPASGSAAPEPLLQARAALSPSLLSSRPRCRSSPS